MNKHLTLLHSEGPKLDRVLAHLGATGLNIRKGVGGTRRTCAIRVTSKMYLQFRGS